MRKVNLITVLPTSLKGLRRIRFNTATFFHIFGVAFHSKGYMATYINLNHFHDYSNNRILRRQQHYKTIFVRADCIPNKKAKEKFFSENPIFQTNNFKYGT